MAEPFIVQILPGATAVLALLVGGATPLIQRGLDQRSLRGKKQRELAAKILSIWEDAGSVDGLRNEHDLWLALMYGRQLRKGADRELVVNFVSQARNKSTSRDDLMATWEMVVDALSETARS